MRWVAGFLLVGAAILKAVELMAEPAAAMLNPLGRYFLPVEIGVELAVGLLVLSGLYWRTLRWLVLVLFTGFAGYSLYLAMKGAASCGCFGPVQINPWWTFGLDAVVVLGLLASVLIERRRQGNELAWSEALLTSTVPSRHRALAVVMGVTVISTALLFRYADQRAAFADRLLTSVGDLVILEPEHWIGQKLPIADAVDVDLSQGEWIVLLHRHDCPVCRKEVPRYEQRAAAGERIALVEVPPFGVFEPREKTCRYGRLKEDHEWFVETPVELRLHDGIVTAVKSHDQ